jgi:hypothetical protein
MKIWKVLGLAGIAGVAAAGVIITREQRQRTQLAPEEIRARLHQRLAEAPATPAGAIAADVPASQDKRRRWIPRRRRRRVAPVR